MHEEDRYLTLPIDVIIDAARDLIEWLLVHRHDEAVRLIIDWGKGDIPILKRLAIHAMCLDSVSSGDQKLKWLLQRGWLYSLPLRHEAFRLIKTAYPISEESTRNDFLEAVLQGPREQGLENLDVDAMYDVWELLELITDADPDCSKAANAFLKAKQYCPDLVAKADRHLAMNDRATLPTVKPSMQVKEILDKEPAAILDYLLKVVGDNIHGLSGEGLLAKLRQAVAESFDWGIQLALQLQDRGYRETDIWRAILGAWIASKLSEPQLIRVFSLLSESNLLQSFGNYVEELLFEKTRSTDLESQYLWLPSSERLAEELWVAQVRQSKIDSHEEHEAADFNDWTFAALNQPGGRTAWSLMYMLSTRRREAGKDWMGIPEYYKHFLDQILSDNSRPAELGRIFLSWNIPFLLHIDAKWTRTRVLPMLDWSKDQRTAEQAWHGFLGMGRLSVSYSRSFDHNTKAPFHTHPTGSAISRMISFVKLPSRASCMISTR